MSDVGGWSDEKQNEAAIDITNGIVTIDTDTGEKVIRNYAPARSAMWNDYTVSVDVGGFALPADGSQAGISVLKPPGSAYEQEGRVDVTVYAHAYSIQGLAEHRPAAAGRSRPASRGDRRDGHPGGRHRR